MKIEPIKQPNSIACGPTCIFMTTQYFGDKVSFKEIEKISKYKKEDGMTDEAVVTVCTKLGYKAKRMLNCSWKDLVAYNTKDAVLIVSWMVDGYKGHVSVVEKVTKTHIFIADPIVGKVIKINKIQFMRLWMEYDGLWWPNVSSDIHLRPLIVVKK